MTVSALPEHSDELVCSGKPNNRKAEVFKPESYDQQQPPKKKCVDVSDQCTSYYNLTKLEKDTELACELFAELP